jgi:hypothetical protein
MFQSKSIIEIAFNVNKVYTKYMISLKMYIYIYILF